MSQFDYRIGGLLQSGIGQGFALYNAQQQRQLAREAQAQQASQFDRAQGFREQLFADELLQRKEQAERLLRQKEIRGRAYQGMQSGTDDWWKMMSPEDLADMPTDVQSAFGRYSGRAAEFTQNRQMAEQQVQGLRSSGMLKYVKPSKVQDWMEMGIQFAPEELPRAMQEQALGAEEMERQALIDSASIIVTPDGGVGSDAALRSTLETMSLPQMRAFLQQKQRADVINSLPPEIQAQASALDDTRLQQLAGTLARRQEEQQVAAETYEPIFQALGSSDPAVRNRALAQAQAAGIDTGMVGFAVRGQQTQSPVQFRTILAGNQEVVIPQTRGGELAWDPNDPNVQLFLTAAESQLSAMPGAGDDGGFSNPPGTALFGSSEKRRAWESQKQARINAQAQRLAQQSGWVIVQPEQSGAMSPDERQGGAAAAVPNQSEVQAAIRELIARGVADPAQIKAELQARGLNQ